MVVLENIFSKVGSVAVLGIGVYLSYYIATTSNDVSPLLLLKALGCLAVGIIFNGYNLYSFGISLLNNYKNKSIEITQTKEEEKTMPAEKISLVGGVEIQPEQLKDQETLFYLTERLKNDEEGLELCRKLADKLFLKHHGKGKE